jgi:ligand-binding sensor domain-containing protein
LLFASELQGLVEYRHGELEPQMLPSSPTAVAQTEDGTVWIGTREKGLFRFNPEKRAQELQPVPSVTNARINCLLPIANATLLIATNNMSVTRISVLNKADICNTSTLANRAVVLISGPLAIPVWGYPDPYTRHPFELPSATVQLPNST